MFFHHMRPYQSHVSVLGWNGVYPPFCVDNQSRKHKQKQFFSLLQWTHLKNAPTCQTKIPYCHILRRNWKAAVQKHVSHSLHKHGKIVSKRRAKPPSKLVKEEPVGQAALGKSTWFLCSSEVAGSNHTVACFTNYGFDHANTHSLPHKRTHTEGGPCLPSNSRTPCLKMKSSEWWCGPLMDVS